MFLYKENFVNVARVALFVSLVGAAFSNEVSAQSVPSPWVAGDIGSPALVGGVTYNQGTYTVNAAGKDIWSTADQFHFVYQRITGDVDISLRVRSVSRASGWSKTGVMIRETLSSGSRHAFALLSASNGYGFHTRIDPNGFTDAATGVTGAAPGWVRLVRSGSQIEAFRSANGTTWISLGVDVVPMADSVYVGIATTSHTTSATTKAVLDTLRVTATATPPPPPPTNQLPVVTLTGPASGATYVAPASVPLTATASDTDGSIARVEFYSGTTLLGTDTTAPYSFTWSSVPAGGYSLTAAAYDNVGAKVTSAAKTVTVSTTSSTAIPAPWTASDIGSPALAGSASYTGGVFSVNGAGIDIWDTADQFQFVYQAVAGDVEIVARVKSLTRAQDYTNAGVMIRATMGANAAHGYTTATSSQGVFFRRRVATGSVTSSVRQANVAAPVWVRLVRRGTLVTSYFSSDGSNWTAIGSQTLPLGSVAYVGLAVNSHDAAARTTATFSNVSVTTSTQNQVPVVALTAPASGASYVAPASVALTATASDTDGTIARVEFYSGTTLLGTDTSSPYSFTWSSAAAGTYSLTAVAYDNAGATGTSAARTITVTPTANHVPVVSLTGPASGATYVAPGSVPLTATASDTDGTIARVEFYSGATLLGTDTSSPYSFTWSSVPAGSYSLTAAAYDNVGAKVTSAARTITVTAVTTAPPTAIAFHASVDHATVMSYRLDVFASGANPATATPVATSDLAKGTPDASGDITVNRATFFSAMAAGNYLATVTSVGSAGSSQSLSVAFTR